MKLNYKKEGMMKSAFTNMVAAAVLMVTGSALAVDMPPLAQKYNCTNCHSVDVKMIGPSWMDISKAYNNNGKTAIGTPVSELLRSKTAEEWLKYKISHGGAGNWGTVLMPATDPSDRWQADLDLMVKDIMSLSKGGAAKGSLLKTADKYHCAACHAMDKKVIGPSWMDISKAYSSNGTTAYGVKVSDILGSKTPEEWLLQKISHGGMGAWGTMLMPAIEYKGQADAKKDDVKKHDDIMELVKFIMGLAKK
ncbi:MAG: hypothetical protein HYZ46_00360 [Nitrosomonadales bacterium]|nr:hypothetical protein [Nitrosomonadales bacterium]